MAGKPNVTVTEFIEEKIDGFQRNFVGFFFAWYSNSFSKFPKNDEKKRRSLSFYDTKRR